MKLARKISQFSTSEINQIFKQAHRVAVQDELTILHSPRIKDYGRALLMVSKKVGNAPTRNKLRRQLKAIFYEEKLYDTKFDWVFILRKPAVKLSFDQLKNILLCTAKKQT